MSKRPGAAADELDTLAEGFGTPAIAAAAAWAHVNHSSDPRAAAGSLRRAARLWREVGAPYEAARAQVALAEAHLLEDDRDAAALEARSARSTFERLGAEPDATRARELIVRATGAPASWAMRTFLFTDVVGSTSLLEAVGDEAWGDLRRWHDRALRSCFEGHGGEEIDHAGCGFFIAFADPGSAIACAVDVQRRLAEHRRTHGFAPQVRIGVHAAEALETAGEYTGKGVHSAVRIGDLAAGGDILVDAPRRSRGSATFRCRSHGPSTWRASPTPSSWSRSHGANRTRHLGDSARAETRWEVFKHQPEPGARKLRSVMPHGTRGRGRRTGLVL